MRRALAGARPDTGGTRPSGRPPRSVPWTHRLPTGARRRIKSARNPIRCPKPACTRRARPSSARRHAGRL